MHEVFSVYIHKKDKIMDKINTRNVLVHRKWNFNLLKRKNSMDLKFFLNFFNQETHLHMSVQ